MLCWIGEKGESGRGDDDFKKMTPQESRSSTPLHHQHCMCFQKYSITNFFLKKNKLIFEVERKWKVGGNS